MSATIAGAAATAPAAHSNTQPLPDLAALGDVVFDDAELPGDVRRERGRIMPDVMAPSDCLKLYNWHRNDNPNEKVYHGWWIAKDRETGEVITPRWTVGWGKRASASRKIQEALDTVYGYRKTGNEVTVGFAAMNYDTRQTRWAAIDWDYSAAEPERAATWAKRAFHVCHALLGMTVLLEKSGRGGWHLFLYETRWRPVEEWTRWLERLCVLIGVPQDRVEEDGTCELFPPKGAWRPQLKCGNAIRLPGTYNGRAGKLAEVVFENISPMLAELATPAKPGSWRQRISDLPNNKEEKLCSGFVLKDSAGKVMPEQAEKVAQLLNIDLSRVEISDGRRRAAMKRLNGQVFPKAGKVLALALAEVYFNKAGGTANCRDWPEHLREVEDTWAWMIDSIFLPSLTAEERAIYDQLDTDTLRDAFRIVRNFAWADARKGGSGIFEVSTNRLAAGLLMTPQNASVIRQRLIALRAIKQEAPHIVGRRGALFSWLPCDRAALMGLSVMPAEEAAEEDPF
jgi:hypothetical protein